MGEGFGSGWPLKNDNFKNFSADNPQQWKAAGLCVVMQPSCLQWDVRSKRFVHSINVTNQQLVAKDYCIAASQNVMGCDILLGTGRRGRVPPTTHKIVLSDTDLIWFEL